MPRSYINHSLRTRAPYGPATVRAYEKEKSFAPALVSQEAADRAIRTRRAKLRPAAA